MITDVSETVTVTTIRPGRNVNYMSPVWTQMQAVNDLEGGDGCWLFPAEVAANTTTLQAFLHHGDHLLISEAAFHGTKTVCENFLKSNGVKVDTIPWDATDLTKWINPETKAVFVESPGSVTLEVMDLPSICESAHDHGVLVIADNTYGSGWLYCPLQLGCDVSIIAGTEYLSGHADVMMGATTARGEAAKPLRKAVRRQRPIAGAGRGLRDATRHAYAEPAYEASPGKCIAGGALA